MQREVITGLGRGNPNLIPRVLGDPQGAGLLDIVHPVDRSLVAGWIEEGIGVSQPFRRAAADEPTRWFRFVSVTPPRGEAPSAVLMEEVTSQVREALLRERLSSTLARNTGNELVEGSAKVGAELAGVEAACLTEIHPPLGVVRASHGKTVLGPGTTFPLSQTPLNRLNAESGIVELSGEILKTYGHWGPFRLLGARFVAMVPVVDLLTGTLVGGLVCLSSVPRALSSVERELLGFLAVRLGAELGRPRPARRFAAPDLQGLEVSEEFLRVLSLAISGRGITHTLNNLLGGQLLNAELAAGQLSGDTNTNPYLERVVMASRKGAAIMSRISDLTGWEQGQRDFIPLPEVVDEAVQLVHDLYEANRVEVHAGGAVAVVWGDPRLLRAMVLALVAPAVEQLGPETKVILDIQHLKDEALARLEIVVSEPAVPIGLNEGPGEGFELGVAVAARVAVLHGGRLEREDSGDTLRVRVTLRAMSE